MNFMDYLQLTIEFIRDLFDVVILRETTNGTTYNVTLGGFLLACFLLALIFRAMFSLSGLVAVPNLRGGLGFLNRHTVDSKGIRNNSFSNSRVSRNHSMGVNNAGIRSRAGGQK